MTLDRFLIVLRIFYQGLRHITAGLKTEIEHIEQELKAKDGQQDSNL